MDITIPPWKHTNFMSPVGYILDARIVEYDIEKANISVLLDAGVISQVQYQDLYELPKRDREVAVGKMQLRDKKVSDVLKNGIMAARKALCERLDLDYGNILSIKNDAIFVVSSGFDIGLQTIEITPNVRFKKKSTFRSFYKLNRKEFYYDFNPITREHISEVKGLGDYAYGLQKDYLISALNDIFFVAMSENPRSALMKLKMFYNSYMAKELPIEFYRRMDSNCRYEFLANDQYATFQADYLLVPDIRVIDPSYNASLLSTLAGYFIEASLRGNK